MKNIIKRDQYINKIEPFIDQQIVKVITGHRRVGKSYILYQLMEIIMKKRNLKILVGGITMFGIGVPELIVLFLIFVSFFIIELEKYQCLMYLITSGVLLLKYTVI